MIELTLKLLIAHVLGDFVFQSDKWVENKKQNRHKSPYLYYHLLIHLLATCVVLQFKISYWPIIITIVLSHYIIDLVKLNFKHNNLYFILDQLAHIIVIGILVYIYEPFTVKFDLLYSTQSLILILAILCVTYVSAIFMKLIMNKWVLDEDNPNNSLQHAGKYIGILERLFVFGFIVLNQWAAIGLLITAKSVFRFGDLSRAKDRKLTEYILIGTLLSFGFALLTGLIYLQIKQ
ncbi:DUF3307 domain-containing protein [Marinifilum sp. RC60d5]|uniref:DUF3307 domain-containing protein n=1 Tax=Marinifilum sp. RC60d5 TaxID=3458414 RepID=UPI004035121B